MEEVLKKGRGYVEADCNVLQSGQGMAVYLCAHTRLGIVYGTRVEICNPPRTRPERMHIMCFPVCTGE